ncbi:MAG: DNA gyrase inhibitor YacG [Pseudomonadota bacterium]|nr:DNA gyrase inhibitor YacG [Pseudomonadota bacterium]
MLITCPTCKKVQEYLLDNLYRPFCSERCQIIDLGSWADERFKLQSQEDDSINLEENKNNSDDTE